jgi:hypothetical protein
LYFSRKFSISSLRISRKISNFEKYGNRNYQFKSKLYLDLDSLVNCDQRIFDVNDEKSNDSLKEKSRERYYERKEIYHFSSMDFVFVVVVFYFSFYYLFFVMKNLLTMN